MKEIKIDYWSNGNKRIEEHFINGTLHGYWNRWYEDGCLMYETNWKNGRRDGLQINWNFNRSRRHLAMWKQNHYHGIIVDFAY